MDVDESGELSTDEFERFFETLVKEWRAKEEALGKKIAGQYAPLLLQYEPPREDAEGPRKGLLRLLQREGHEFWSDKPLASAVAAGHWSARLGYDDQREVFELAAAYQTEGRFVGGESGTKVHTFFFFFFYS